MINETLRFSPLTEATPASYEASSTSRDISHLLAKLQPGDYIEGTLIEAENGTVLKLGNGISVPVNLLDAVDIGKLLSFVVVGKENQKLILQPKIPETLSNGQLIDKIMSELKLPNQIEMKNIIGQFIEKQLPLNKESLLSIFQGHKTYDLPTEMLVNLKSSEVPLVLKDIEQLSYLKSEGIKGITEAFKGILEGMKNMNQLENVVHDFGHALSLEQLEKAIKASLIDEQTGKYEESKSLKENRLVDGSPAQSRSAEVILKDWFSSISMEEFRLEQKVNDYFRGQPEIFYEKVLKTLAEAIFKSYLEVDIKQINNHIKESEKITGTSERVEAILEHLGKLDLSEERKEKLQQVHQMFQVVQKYNIEAQYFCFPMVFNNQESTGELYFFKPKKKQGNSDERMYIVMALNMPFLRKVEVHIEQIKDAVNMTLKVETQTMKEQIESSLEQLSEELGSSGYHLNQLQVKLLKDNRPKEEIYTGLYHMDLKA